MHITLFILVGTLFTLMFLVTIRSIIQQSRSEKGLIIFTVMLAIVFFYLCVGLFAR